MKTLHFFTLCSWIVLMVAAFILDTKQSVLFLQKSSNIQHSGQPLRRNILSFIVAQYLEENQEHLVTEAPLCHRSSTLPQKLHSATETPFCHKNGKM